jgi:hypothetical protein
MRLWALRSASHSDWPVCPIAETASPHRMGAALTYALFSCLELPGKVISMRRIWVQHPNRGPNSHPSPAIGASRR